MATREKKTPLKKSNSPSPLPKEEELAQTELTEPETEEIQTETKTPLVKKLSNKTPRKINKKPLFSIKLKPKVKKNVGKINPKLIKTILKNPKNPEAKKKLLKNGVKQVRPRQNKLVKKDEQKDEQNTENQPKADDNDLPPVLEPIFPIDDNTTSPAKKKRATGPRKPKLQDETTPKKVKRKRKVETSSTISDTIDQVINEIASFIKNDSKEESDKLSEQTEPVKTKKITKRKRKENIENTETKFGPIERKVIDMLDLNVEKIKKGQNATTNQRRHSIEKFPISTPDQEGANNQIRKLPNVARCISPLFNAKTKMRQTTRINPYKTRSDSPARILRNGKHRKLKDLGLLEGLDPIQRKKRRQCADYSGSEVSLSKFSGYESDSSFSDMSSLHGGTENPETIKDEIKIEKEEQFESVPVVVKRSASSEDNQIDTISNCVDINLIKENNDLLVSVKTEEEEELVSPNLKVPDKDLILDSMKQTFNDVFIDEDEKRLKNTEESHIELSHVAETKIGANEIVKNDGEVKEYSNGGVIDVRIEESPENLVIKENILQALGLQSLKAAEEAKLRNKERTYFSRNDNNYTGTLKTVIKLNRDKKRRNPIKMTLQKNSKSGSKGIDCDGSGGGSTANLEDGYKIMKEGNANWKHGGQSSDTAGAHRKSHYSNRSTNMDGSSEHTSDGEAGNQEGAAKSLVIPEKASSFSIHPGRLCKDECSYCFGKFGLFDTPCHIAQMKSVERQNKILQSEKHLTRDSCLCDACYRHVDRKSNTPSYINKSYKRSTMVAPGPKQDHCHVLGCSMVAANILRRKWIIKMRKSICQAINIDLDNPGLHSIPICEEHYSALEHLMVCAICKRRLARNHIHYLGPETSEVNAALNAEDIPLTLADKPVVCKLCKCFATIILKPPEERPENSLNFFNEYKKRLLHFNDIVPMDEAAAEEPITVPTREKTDKEQVKKRKRLTKNHPYETSNNQDEEQLEQEKHEDQIRFPSSDSTSQSRPESPSDYMIDYNTLIPSIAMECDSDSESQSKKSKKTTRPESVKQVVEMSKNKHKHNEIAVQRLGSNPSISVRQLFPCEEDLPLQGGIDFANVKERTPEGWEKCCSIIQYDLETKQLWQELQKPYGNQSSFLRHLILLEKYFRNGDLVLTSNASHHSVNYTESVHNRLRAYDNISSSAINIQPLSMLPFNRAQKSSSGIITSTNLKEVPIVTLNAANIPKNIPISVAQLQPITNKPPPGLISLQPGTNRPIAPLKVPQSQKIKFPITKNWRPNLIPIDPSQTANERKRTGLVQVISGGKPFHITLEDYRKMCAIKKSFEAKQKRLQENKLKPVKQSPKKQTVQPKVAISPKIEPVPEPENILEKLDKQIEKLESKFNSPEKPALNLPKIPKSLTVIPQTVTRKPSRPSSPVLLITPKPKPIANKS